MGKTNTSQTGEIQAEILIDFKNEITSDLPSFVKSGIEWDELCTAPDSIKNTLLNGADPTKIIKDFFSARIKRQFFYKGKCASAFWSIENAASYSGKAIISIKMKLNDKDGKCPTMKICFGWDEIADAVRKRIEQEDCYNKIIDGDYVFSRADNGQYIVTDKTDNSFICSGTREYLFDYFRSRLNRNEADNALYFEIAPLMNAADKN